MLPNTKCRVCNGLNTHAHAGKALNLMIYSSFCFFLFSAFFFLSYCCYCLSFFSHLFACIRCRVHCRFVVLCMVCRGPDHLLLFSPFTSGSIKSDYVSQINYMVCAVYVFYSVRFMGLVICSMCACIYAMPLFFLFSSLFYLGCLLVDSRTTSVMSQQALKFANEISSDGYSFFHFANCKSS